MIGKSSWRMVAVLLLALPLLALGCQSKQPAPDPPACPELDAGTPIDPALAAFLGKARAAHHSADILEDKQQLEDAIRVLSKLSQGEGRPDRAEAREVQADTLARLADLKSRLGRFDEASSDLELGMTLVVEPTYFRGHLVETRGLVAERHAKALHKQGQSEAAKALEEEALKAFEESMSIQQRVIEETLRPKAP